MKAVTIEKHAEIASPSNFSRGLVLVAEPDVETRDYIAGVLGDKWQVELAEDAETATHLAHDHRPDVIVSDVAGLLQKRLGQPGTDIFLASCPRGF